MTAPVIVESENIAMTAPVVVENQSEHVRIMSFVMPKSKYKNIAELPVPNQSDVMLKEQPEETMVVSTFSGSFTKYLKDQKLKELLENVKKDYPDIKLDEIHPVYMGYNPPWTISFLRTNELGLKVINLPSQLSPPKIDTTENVVSSQ